MTDPPAILVIKHGALGDFVQAFGPFQAIRRHHRDARIVLLTTAPFVDLATQTGWFDVVWVDERPKPLQAAGWLALRRRLRGGRFARVYDLQTSTRSSAYFQLLRPGPRPEWSGIAPGCSHPHDNPRRDVLHTLERQAEQLARAGIAAVPPPDFSWLPGPPAGDGDDPPPVLLVPGGSGHRPGKRWPAERYAALASRLIAAGQRPVLIGTAGEADLHARIRAACPGAESLAGRTGLTDLARLARRAAAAIGNDTGPMHLFAVAGCPSVVLFSAESNPALCAPRGPAVTVLRRSRLADLGLEEVLSAVAFPGAVLDSGALLSRVPGEPEVVVAKR